MRNNISMIEIMWAIRDIPSFKIDLYEKALLFFLNSFSQPEKNESWHSYESLAKISGMSKNTLIRRVKSLEQKKYISVKRVKNGCKNASNRYCLNYDLIFETSTYVSSATERPLYDLAVPQRDLSSATERLVVVPERDPKYKKKYKKEKEKGKTVGAACEAPPVTPIKRLDPNFDIGKFPALAKYLPKVVKGMKS